MWYSTRFSNFEKEYDQNFVSLISVSGNCLAIVMTETKAIQKAMLKSWSKTEPIDKEVEVVYKGEKPSADPDVCAVTAHFAKHIRITRFSCRLSLPLRRKMNRESLFSLFFFILFFYFLYLLSSPLNVS
jgi:hypothetical protein